MERFYQSFRSMDGKEKKSFDRNTDHVKVPV